MPQAQPESKLPTGVLSSGNAQHVTSFFKQKIYVFVTNAKNIYLQKKAESKGFLAGLKGLPVTDESETEAPL